MWDLQTTIRMNEKEAAEQIARLAILFNKRTSVRGKPRGVALQGIGSVRRRKKGGKFHG